MTGSRCAALDSLQDVTALRYLPRTARRALWLGGLLVVLAGVLGMHGLGTHGTGEVAPAGVSAHADHALGAMPVARSVAALEAPADHGAMDMGGGDMCVAILLGSLLVLFLVGARSGQGRFLFSPTRPISPTLRRARSPDPPSLIALSVQRC